MLVFIMIFIRQRYAISSSWPYRILPLNHPKEPALAKEHNLQLTSVIVLFLFAQFASDPMKTWNIILHQNLSTKANSQSWYNLFIYLFKAVSLSHIPSTCCNGYWKRKFENLYMLWNDVLKQVTGSTGFIEYCIIRWRWSILASIHKLTGC